jgi:hypothetical protein
MPVFNEPHTKLPIPNLFTEVAIFWISVSTSMWVMECHIQEKWTTQGNQNQNNKQNNLGVGLLGYCHVVFWLFVHISEKQTIFICRSQANVTFIHTLIINSMCSIITD